MSKRKGSEEGRIVRWFQEAPLDAAVALSRVVSEVVRGRQPVVEKAARKAVRRNSGKVNPGDPLRVDPATGKATVSAQ